MFIGWNNDSLGDDFDKPFSNAMILIGQIVTYFFSVDIKHSHLDSFDDFFMDFFFSFSVGLNFLLYFLYFFWFVLLHFLQFLGNIKQQELLILRIFSQVSEQRVGDALQIMLELIKQLPHP